MAKGKQLPTDTDELRNLYDKLKDKEMKLEADLAIKEHPEVEEAIIKVALALADVKKMDEQIHKAPKAADLTTQSKLEALINRANYLKNQLEIVEQQILRTGGTDAERLTSLKKQRDCSFRQLVTVFEKAQEVFGRYELDLRKVVPSISDFIQSENQ